MLMRQTLTLLNKEIRSEWREKNGLASVIMYLVSATFICFLSFKSVADDETWNALLWLIILFSSFYTVTKSFYKETPGKMLYYYTAVMPQAYILSKILFNGILLSITSLINYVVYALFMEDLVLSHEVFILALILGSFALSSVACMASAIAAKAGQLRLTTVIGLPIVLPALMIIVRFSMMSVQGKTLVDASGYLLATVGLNVVIVGLSYLLFPYLWRD